MPPGEARGDDFRYVGENLGKNTFDVRAGVHTTARRRVTIGCHSEFPVIAKMGENSCIWERITLTGLFKDRGLFLLSLQESNGLLNELLDPFVGLYASFHFW